MKFKSIKTNFKKYHLDHPVFISIEFTKWRSGIVFETAGYFDPRPNITTNLSTVFSIIIFIVFGFSLYSLLIIPILVFGFGFLIIKLPYDTKIENSEGGKSYGIQLYHVDAHDWIFDHIWVRLGNFSKTFYMPWAIKLHKREVLMKNTSWEERPKSFMLKGSNLTTKEYEKVEKEFKSKIQTGTYDYTYILKNGETQKTKANLSIEKSTLYYSIFKLFKLFPIKRKYLNVEFENPIGEGVESWKGGTVGCGYLMNKGEDIIQCIKRMELNRDFK